MPATRHSVEQIIAKLREVEKLTGQGMTIPMAAKKVGITDQTFYRWRIRYGALKEDEAKRLLLLEQENSRHAAGSATGEILSPARRRDAVVYVVKRHKVSERRACKVVGQHRSTQRYSPMAP
jgi:transposase-like protein